VANQQRKKIHLYNIFTILSVNSSVAITEISINRGTYLGIPYFYAIPVVLIAYNRPNISTFVTDFVG